jgi:hypothetical protein
VASGRFFAVIKFLKEEEMLHVQEPLKHFTFIPTHNRPT